MLQRLKYHFLLHLIVFIWGFTGILGKLIELDHVTIVWWRVVIAVGALFIYLKLKKWSFKVHSKKQFFAILGVGVLVALHWITFYKSIQLSTASLAILCLSTTTLHVTWLEPIIMKRKFLPLEFVFGLLIIVALLYVSGDFNPKDVKAMYYGFVSALFAALFSVCNAKLVQKTPSPTITLLEMGMGVVFITGLLLYENRLDSSLFEMTPSDLGWLLFLGIVCTSFAFLVVIDIVDRLGAFTVSLSINLEPVYTILLAIFILQENELLTNKFYFGSAMIVAIVIANAVIKYKMKAKDPNVFIRE